MPEPEMPIADADLAQFEPEQFAQLIAFSTDDQISAVIHGPLRPKVLDQIFTRMADHVEPSQIENLDAVVHFKILDRPAEHGGGYDHYEVIFAEGSTVLTRRWTWRQANHTLTLLETHSIEINIDLLPPMELDELHAIASQVMALVQEYCGGTLRYEVLSPLHPSMSLR
jgi:hypothetical protein